MKKDRNFYFHAEEFIKENLPMTVTVYAMQVGFGYINFRSPAIYVALPSNEQEDHVLSVCSLFHEYGHFLDMQLWINNNSCEGDMRHCSIQYNNYLEKIGVHDTPNNSRDKNNILKNEQNARKYGKEGLTIGSNDIYKGLQDYDSIEFVPKDWLLNQYEIFSEKMYQTYLNCKV